MKTTILVTGQISGNFKLAGTIRTIDCDFKKGMFNSFELTFPTKKMAIDALSSARKIFLADGETVRYIRANCLSYDASSAKILN